MDWSKVKADFEWDGALRDIYVLDASVDDWRKVMLALRQSGLSMCFKQDREAMPLPHDITEFLDGGDGLLTITVDGMLVNCHFFDSLEIEFDLDPREVTTEHHAVALTDFMGLIGMAVSKPVILTYENGREDVIYRWTPEAP